MKKAAAIPLTILLAAGFVAVAMRLFDLQFAGGDVYPMYCTLRSDPAGARLLFESLGRLPGLAVGRSYQPLERLEDRDSTVLLLGLDPRRFAMQPAEALKAFQEFAARGNRLVLGMGPGSGRAPPRRTALEQSWGIRFGLDFDKAGKDILYFADAKNWEVLERSGQRPLVVEKAFGKGGIVLAAAGRLFNNQSVAEARQTALLARILGPHTRILFDEAHFGIVESGSIVALARRYRLHGLALGLAICAALFIWKNAAGFPPVARETPTERISGRTSVSGLITLLRRYLPPERLTAACWQEWLKDHGRDVPPARRAQAEAAACNLADRPAEALREIQAILLGKGAI
jgi:hypothetical protein